MAEFAYNNAKNASTSHIPFELNYGYYSRMSYKDKVDLCSKSKSADELLAELRKLVIVCRENLHHTQKLQKQAYNKGVRSRSYAFSDKVWLNSKYIKTKQNRKLEAKFFELFQVFLSVGKQAYKIKLSKKWKIHDVFHILLLEQNNIRKDRVDENIRQKNFDASNNKSREYKVEVIWNSAAYMRESETGHLLGLYYLVFRKSYLEKKNT